MTTFFFYHADKWVTDLLNICFLQCLKPFDFSNYRMVSRLFKVSLIYLSYYICYH